MERVNHHCVTGFPDVHMSFIMGELGGTLASEAVRPDMDEAGECDRSLNSGGTRERMVDYVFDFFTRSEKQIVQSFYRNIVDSSSMLKP